MLKQIVSAQAALALLTSVAAAQTPGSYQESCATIRQRGTVLSAICETLDGRARRTSIDLRGCLGDIANADGRLACVRLPALDDDDAEPTYRAGEGEENRPFHPYR